MAEPWMSFQVQWRTSYTLLNVCPVEGAMGQSTKPQTVCPTLTHPSQSPPRVPTRNAVVLLSVWSLAPSFSRPPPATVSCLLTQHDTCACRPTAPSCSLQRPRGSVGLPGAGAATAAAGPTAEGAARAGAAATGAGPAAGLNRWVSLPGFGSTDASKGQHVLVVLVICTGSYTHVASRTSCRLQSQLDVLGVLVGNGTFRPCPVPYMVYVPCRLAMQLTNKREG